MSFAPGPPSVSPVQKGADSLPLWKPALCCASLLTALLYGRDGPVAAWHEATLPRVSNESRLTTLAELGPVITVEALTPSALGDYNFLRERVMEEHGWSGARAEGAIVEYMRFMQLLASAPKMELVASNEVDLVWHEHLLDTQNYAADNMRLFGRFLHHRRARTPQEYADIPTAYERTKEAYRAHFGHEPPLRFWGATTEAASMCGGGGGSPNTGGVDPSASGPVLSGEPAVQAEPTVKPETTVQPETAPASVEAASTESSTSSWQDSTTSAGGETTPSQEVSFNIRATLATAVVVAAAFATVSL